VVTWAVELRAMGEYGLGGIIVRAWLGLSLTVVIFLYEARNLHQTLNNPYTIRERRPFLTFTHLSPSALFSS
jgi:hypothetical protein